MGLRQRILDGCLRVLAKSHPLTARELVPELMSLGIEADKSLVNSVLFHEGSDLVEHDPAAGLYRSKTAGSGSDDKQGIAEDSPELVVTERWKAGGIIAAPAFPGWEVEARDQGHGRGFILLGRRVGDAMPRRVERTSSGTHWDDARERAGWLILTLAASGES
jgi:hypothetical protein